MSNWPPDPNKVPDNQPSNNQPPQNPNNKRPHTAQIAPVTGGREWHLLEKTLLASIEEQRRARRWRVISKLLSLGTLLLVIFMLSKGCTPSEKGLATVDVNKPHIAVVELQGVISANDPANAYDVSKALTEAFESKGSKAVVMNINSPGGSPVQSDEIWQTMMDLREEYPKKKLYAIIGDMGASGAYYIASAADEIYVNPSSLVGSIGVIMPGYNVEGLMDKLGVEDRTITAGEYKDILSVSRELTDFEQQHVQSVLSNTHKHFINAVKQGRGDKLKDAEENNLFSGLFWTGEQSIELGLADKKGSLMTLEKELDLDNVINYTPVDPMQQLLDSFAIKMGAGIGSSVDMKLLPQEQSTTEMR
ncbi:signal peptide peptidase SppA [Psychrobacter sp. FDAARGOS_221]|uniref:signal peptide peptidase SppA n=1 Tax=Psychrobacter sp. FDAARGOS_221 TaxID=1975705 RepID=UPI000BB56F03|nr:signal peptide peptidase SppA [Psychrobacter sp. FDAARGOS_221]PNK61427.1 signal peptide peptidase SppA [Psychrobacter sp. FDAARGOS_221]